jgi:hypothetical protein
MLSDRERYLYCGHVFSEGCRLVPYSQACNFSQDQFQLQESGPSWAEVPDYGAE